MKDDKFIVDIESNMKEFKSDLKKFETQLSSLKSNSNESPEESGELGNYIKELKEDYDKEFANVLSRLHALEERQDHMTEKSEYNKTKNSDDAPLGK